MNKIVNGVANDYEFPFLEKTTENYMQVIDGTGMYYEWYVKHLQQELQRKDNVINEYESKGYDIATERANFLLEIQELQQVLQRKEHNWNELKEWVEDYIKLFDNPDILEEQTLEDLKEVLDKIKELESK